MRRSILSALTLLVACESETAIPATQIMLRIHASAEVLEAGEALAVRVVRQEELEWRERDFAETSLSEIPIWPVDVPVTSNAEDADRSFEFVAEVRDGAGNVLAQARAITGFVARQSRLLEVELGRCGDRPLGEICEVDPECHGTSCLDCRDGACRETSSLPGSQLARFDPVAAIASDDAGAFVVAAFDAAADASAEEAGSDAETDDAETEDTEIEDAETEDAETHAPVCVDDDLRCGAGCTRDSDGDCGKDLSESCAVTEECRADGFCVDGRCCAERCDDPCSACNVPTFEGSCHPRDFSSANDVDNCGACQRSCGKANASAASCEVGRCAYTCSSDWADCNAATNTNDGCEQNIARDPAHCGGCNEAYRCAYPFCHARTCGQPRGETRASGIERIPGEHAVGVLVTLRPSTVVGFGALLRNVSQPVANVRFALYEAGSAFQPGVLRAEAGPTPVVDFPSGGEATAALFTLALTGATDVLAGEYWLLLSADKPIDVMTEGTIYDLRWEGPASGFQRFPQVAPVGGFQDDGPIMDLNVFVVEGSS